MTQASLPPHVASFYRPPLVAGATGHCRGSACFVARHRDVAAYHAALASPRRLYCLGACYAAPAAAGTTARPAAVVAARTAMLLDNVAAGGVHTMSEYRARGGCAGLERVLARGGEAMLAELAASGLRGRGGAGFAAVTKWRAVAAAATPDRRYVVANADEGDPGAYSDRFLVEDDPLRLIEGMAIAAATIGATDGIVYLRAEYPRAAQVLQEALDQARAAGTLGATALAGRPFDVTIVVGGGSYVCGEETAMLNAIEGRRPQVRTRPPYPTTQGLFGRPTLVHNVETLCALPFIATRGGAAFAAVGVGRSRGNKIVALNSLFRRPGLYEVELGTPLRDIVDDLGGGLADGHLVALHIGGPLTGVLPAALLDTPLGFEELAAVGAGLGHGGIVAWSERTALRDYVATVLDFAAYESCGECTPCRLGVRRLHEGLVDGTLTRAEWSELQGVLSRASLCGHGGGVGEFLASVARHFGAEVATWCV